jgi:putative lipoprotein
MLRIVLIALSAAALAGGCQSARTTQPAASLIGTSWVAEEIDGRGVIERAESTLSFDTPERITGHTACNRYFGGLELGDGTIRVKSTGSTRMACAPAIMEQEGRFLDGLAAARVFRLDDRTLLLLDDAGRVRVRLAPRSAR